MVAHFVTHGDLDLIDQLVAVTADLLQVALEQDHPGHVRRLDALAGLGARHAHVEPEDLGRDVLARQQRRRGVVLDEHRHVVHVLADRAGQVVQRIRHGAAEEGVVHGGRQGVVVGIQRVGLGEGLRRLLLFPEALEHQRQVVERVAGLGVQRQRELERAPRVLEATQLEEDLALERAVDRHLAGGLEGPAREEERALEIVEVEDGLGLQVVDLALRAPVEAGQVGLAREQLVAQRNRLRVLAEVLDQQLRAVQVGGDELRIRLQRALELVERLVDLALVPEDLAAAVVRLRAVRMGAQRLVEPRQRLVRAPAVGRLHRLVQAIPVPIVVFHGPHAGRRGGDPSRESSGQHSRMARRPAQPDSVGACP